MRKITAMLLVLLVIGSMSVQVFAETFDLSGFSWEQLLELKAAISKEQLSRDEWEEVTVPEGVWVVGEDIPAGTWTVRCKSGYLGTIVWGDKLDESGHDIAYGKHRDSASVHNPDHDWVEDDDLQEYTFEAVDGLYIVIKYGPLVFTPFTGKPDLGFKKK